MNFRSGLLWAGLVPPATLNFTLDFLYFSADLDVAWSLGVTAVAVLAGALLLRSDSTDRRQVGSGLVVGAVVSKLAVVAVALSIIIFAGP